MIADILRQRASGIYEKKANGSESASAGQDDPLTGHKGARRQPKYAYSHPDHGAYRGDYSAF